MFNYKKFVMINENSDSEALALENEMGNDDNVFSVMSMGTYILVTLKDVNATVVPKDFNDIPVRVMQGTSGAGVPSINVSGPAEVIGKM